MKQCENCESVLVGRFCHNCGQENLYYQESDSPFYRKIPSINTILDRCLDDRIAAIRFLRKKTGLGLHEAKDLVDEVYFKRFPSKRPSIW